MLSFQDLGLMVEAKLVEGKVDRFAHVQLQSRYDPLPNQNGCPKPETLNPKHAQAVAALGQAVVKSPSPWDTNSSFATFQL